MFTWVAAGSCVVQVAEADGIDDGEKTTSSSTELIMEFLRWKKENYLINASQIYFFGKKINM